MSPKTSAATVMAVSDIGTPSPYPACTRRTSSRSPVSGRIRSCGVCGQATAATSGMRSARQMPARQTRRVDFEEPMHLAHRGFRGAPILVGTQVLEDGACGLARFFLLDELVHGVVRPAPVRAHPVVLDERLADRPRDLDDLFLEQRCRAERGGPRSLVRETAEKIDDAGHLG